jgi:hypothetical protein
LLRPRLGGDNRSPTLVPVRFRGRPVFAPRFLALPLALVALTALPLALLLGMLVLFALTSPFLRFSLSR